MKIRIFDLFLFRIIACSLQTRPYCPPTQRYDLHTFPPRCLDCPSIVLNPMYLTSIGSSVRQNRRAARFNPGVPHNHSCGCWRSGDNSSIEISLNASWIVSGLTFQADRARWLRRFSVEASNDNSTFIEWGNYTQSNFSSSALVLFRYPIRATFFRLVVYEYVNHMVNVSSGYPMRINALVSDSGPFSCKCAALSTGECCPNSNMEVKNNTCITCMDPLDINTVMIDGCGRCRAGTVKEQASRRCVAAIPDQTNDSVVVLQTTLAELSGDVWTVRLNAFAGKLLLVLLLTGGQMLPCAAIPTTSACFKGLERDFTPVLWDLNLTESSGTTPVFRAPRQLDKQYIQYDRGKLTLAMKEASIRSWAECGPHQCTGNLVALFISAFDNTPRFFGTVIRQPLVFEFSPPIAPVLVCGFVRGLDPLTVEIQHLVDSNQYVLFTYPALSGTWFLQWDNNTHRIAVTGGILSLPPPATWSYLRVFAGDKQYMVTSPVSITVKNHVKRLSAVKDSIRVSVGYGLVVPLINNAARFVGARHL